MTERTIRIEMKLRPQYLRILVSFIHGRTIGMHVSCSQLFIRNTYDNSITEFTQLYESTS